jgi:succinate dehydrogenase / fumarate reductase cytochrome b subunit
LNPKPSRSAGASSTSSVGSPHFLFRRIHSLLGLLPVGAFLLFHLWENSQSRFGREHYNTYVVEKIQNTNYVFLLEIFVIALPILFHGIYGTYILWKGKSNLRTYAYFRNWIWWLQRVSGVAILAFLTFHVGGTRILAIFDAGARQDMFGHMKALLSNPVILVVYLIGLVLAIFHFCNGLWSMSITWGLATTERAQKTVQVIAAVAFVVITALGIHGLMGFFISS